MSESVQPRLQAYLELLAHGLVLLRDSTYAGEIELCRIESDHLHNIPTLLYESNEHRHEYYIRGERGIYLQRLREVGADEYMQRVLTYNSYSWAVLAEAPGYPLPECGRDD
jgi:hypothetical protein